MPGYFGTATGNFIVGPGLREVLLFWMGAQIFLSLRAHGAGSGALC
jgi:hypothetical protein